MAKPWSQVEASEAYKKLLADNNLQSEECIYFDDSAENVETANNLGIKSFLFEGADKTRGILGLLTVKFWRDKIKTGDKKYG